MTMHKLLEPLIDSDAFQRMLASPVPRVARAEVTGHPYVATAVAESLEAPVLVVTAGPREAERFAAAAAAFLGPDRVALFPAWEALPLEGISPSPEVTARRADAARRARTAEGPFLLVAPVGAAVQRIAPELGAADPLRLEIGMDIPPDVLATRLVSLGYARSDLVMHRGEFAVRGGILDVYPGTAARPVRLEFLGDEIERMRSFSSSSQTSSRPVEEVTIHPVRELVVDDELRERARAATAAAPRPPPRRARKGGRRPAVRGHGAGGVPDPRPDAGRSAISSPRTRGWS